VSDPFVAEIRIFGFNFAPRGWASCDGQLLPISQNTALFSLLGTFYGGDGRSTFALPDLQGRAPMHPGQGPGLSQHDLGETSGETAVTLLESEMPLHQHQLRGNSSPGDLPSPGPTHSLARSAPFIYKAPAGAAAPLALSPDAVGAIGGSQPHNNMMPYLTLKFCIALQGIYPPRG
jgi:microcystin-dependent protein